MLFRHLAVAVAIGTAIAQRPSNTSICDYYTTALLKNNTAANQKTLLTLVVNTAVIGNCKSSLSSLLLYKKLNSHRHTTKCWHQCRWHPRPGHVQRNCSRSHSLFRRWFRLVQRRRKFRRPDKLPRRRWSSAVDEEYAF
jgi:hypothetical protein